MTRADERRQRLVAALDLNRLHIFLPAVMSVGLAFWLMGEVRELARSSREHSRDKQAVLSAREVAALTSGRALSTEPARRGLRPRPVYAVLAVFLLGGSAYLSIGQYVRQQRNIAGADPGVSGEAWLLVLGSCAACVGVLFGITALRAFVQWPTASPSVRGRLLRSPLTTTPSDGGAGLGRPAPWVARGIGATALAAVVLAIVVGLAPDAVQPLDRDVARWLSDSSLPDLLRVADPLGETEVALGLAVIAGLAALRCRVLAAAYGAATVAGLLCTAALRPLVAQERPGGILAGTLDSFPSGHATMAVLFAGAMPLAIGVLVHRDAVITPLRVVFGVGAAASGAHRVAADIHWATDVVGGALIGLALVLAVQWSVATERSHHRCHGCLWTHPPVQPARGMVRLHLETAQALRVTGHATAALAALGLLVLANVRGLPANPEGVVFAPSVQQPVQVALAALISLGAVVAWRWDAAGAVLIALAGTLLGLFAAVQYPPPLAVGITVAFLLPAVLLWLGWQHHRLPHEILAVALVTGALVGGTWVGAARIYDANYGPTHPASTARLLDVDRVDWVWTGALSPTSITVATRLADDRSQAQVIAEPTDGSGTVRRSAVVPVDEHRVAKLRLDGLAPATRYAFRVLADGVEDTARGRGTFRTPAAGPMSFRVAASSCARVGSNGAVFDAIRAQDPLLYLALGDVHYGNIESSSERPFRAAYDRLLTAPGQAALYRDVPIAYVWDDHDYGPNDADGSAPGRSAARAVYRSNVPHAPVQPGDAAIYQAFTIGRVRVILTDSRSERTDRTLLGATQLAWLLDELRTSSRTHALVLWANPLPWIGEGRPGADGWAGYPEERRTIADAIAEAAVTNLVMVSGDAHMVAIDDGTNSDYSTGGGGGFPILHAAALDRPGSVKGGPYSEDAFPGGGQFGLIDITDDGGDEIEVRLLGKRWDGEELVSLTTTLAVPSAASQP